MIGPVIAAADAREGSEAEQGYFEHIIWIDIAWVNLPIELRLQ
jgi:hypothetical protein